MAWYYGEYACGHEGRTNIVGPTKNRQWIADRHFERLCSECWEQKLIEDRVKSAEEAAEKAQEMELPSLVGSEKQITWALTLRQGMIDAFENLIASMPDNKIAQQNFAALLQYLLQTKTTAKFFIDSCQNASTTLATRLAEKHWEEFQALDTPKREQEDIILCPETQGHKFPAKIETSEKAIKVFSEKDETLRSIVKSMQFYWDSDSFCWSRALIDRNGTVEDRAAELANKLLLAGFAVKIPTNEIKDKAISASYEPEWTNWILLFTSGKHKGHLSIRWIGRNEELYQHAKSIPSARWTGETIAVKIDAYKEVLEFATLFGFKLSPGAQKAIDNHVAALAAAEHVSPVTRQTTFRDGLSDILKKEVGIIDDLKD